MHKRAAERNHHLTLAVIRAEPWPNSTLLGHQAAASAHD
jgi:hypothetical protein